MKRRLNDSDADKYGAELAALIAERDKSIQPYGSEIAPAVGCASEGASAPQSNLIDGVNPEYHYYDHDTARITAKTLKNYGLSTTQNTKGIIINSQGKLHRAGHGPRSFSLGVELFLKGTQAEKDVLSDKLEAAIREVIDWNRQHKQSQSLQDTIYVHSMLCQVRTGDSPASFHWTLCDLTLKFLEVAGNVFLDSDVGVTIYNSLGTYEIDVKKELLPTLSKFVAKDPQHKFLFIENFPRVKQQSDGAACGPVMVKMTENLIKHGVLREYEAVEGTPRYSKDEIVALRKAQMVALNDPAFNVQQAENKPVLAHEKVFYGDSYSLQRVLQDFVKEKLESDQQAYFYTMIEKTVSTDESLENYTKRVMESYAAGEEPEPETIDYGAQDQINMGLLKEWFFNNREHLNDVMQKFFETTDNFASLQNGSDLRWIHTGRETDAYDGKGVLMQTLRLLSRDKASQTRSTASYTRSTASYIRSTDLYGITRDVIAEFPLAVHFKGTQTRDGQLIDGEVKCLIGSRMPNGKYLAYEGFLWQRLMHGRGMLTVHELGNPNALALVGIKSELGLVAIEYQSKGVDQALLDIMHEHIIQNRFNLNLALPEDPLHIITGNIGLLDQKGGLRAGATAFILGGKLGDRSTVSYIGKVMLGRIQGPGTLYVLQQQNNSNIEIPVEINQDTVFYSEANHATVAQVAHAAVEHLRPIIKNESKINAEYIGHGQYIPGLMLQAGFVGYNKDGVPYDGEIACVVGDAVADRYICYIGGMKEGRLHGEALITSQKMDDPKIYYIAGEFEHGKFKKSFNFSVPNMVFMDEMLQNITKYDIDLDYQPDQVIAFEAPEDQPTLCARPENEVSLEAPTQEAPAHHPRSLRLDTTI